VTLRQGDEVILPNFGGTSIKNKEGASDAEELFIYRESEIIAKIGGD